MVAPEIPSEALFQHYSKNNLLNTVKLLRKATILYETRAQASKILRGITQIELYLKPKQLVWRYLQEDSEN